MTTPIRSVGPRRMVHEMRGDVQSEVMTVTPKMAEEWLANHKNVRHVRWSWVDALARDMTNGDWKVTHQGIAFNELDELIDGQHRLHAIIKAGIPIRILVCHAKGLTLRDPIDEGRRRTLGVLTGFRPKVVSALTVLRYFEMGAVGTNRPLTLAEAHELHGHHETAIEALSTTPRFHTLLGGAVAALVWAWPCDQTRVEKFAAQIAVGEMIQRGDPAFAFRNWKLAARGRGHPEEVGLAACNCVRAFLVGLRLSSVYTGESGYRALTTTRRVLQQPHTPDAESVPGLSMRSGVASREGNSEE